VFINGNHAGTLSTHGDQTMIRNLLIAASTVAVLATASAATASAKTHINVTLGGGYHSVGCDPRFCDTFEPRYGYDDDYGYGDDEDCGYQWQSYKKWNRYHTAFRIKQKRVWVCE
jgi:hypothetical protein